MTTEIDAKYKFIRIISSSRQSNVWLAKSIDSGKFVAIKELSRSYYSRHETLTSHVWNERNLLVYLTAVKYPYTPHLIETAKTETSLFLILELVFGAPLHLHVQFINTDIARVWFLQIIGIIEYLHSENIMVRDVKISNFILESKTGKILICDFGHAKRTRERAYSICGTHEAPEVGRQRSDGYDHRVDFWNLGILLGFLDTSMNPDKDDLIEKLLKSDPDERLTNFDDIRSHPFFVNSLNSNPYIDKIGNEYIFGPKDKWDNF